MGVLATVFSLLLSTALLLVGHGLQLTLIPLRGAGIGLSELMIGVSASCYFLGFVAGCLGIPRLIARVGHIRSFAVLTAVMISAVLCLEMLGYWQAWLLLRFLTGSAIAGLYSVIESWLNSQSTPQSRGRILAVYTFVTLSAMMGGQFLINVGPVESSLPFTVAALFWSFTAICLLFAIYITIQTRSPRAIAVTEQTPFSAAASDTAPAGFELDPRAPVVTGPKAAAAKVVTENTPVDESRFLTRRGED